MVKRYDCYNDYELLYLIKDGNEQALNYFFKKYDCLIKKIAINLYPNGDKINDLVQEGRMVLYDCIKKYNNDFGICFYSYFIVALKRKYYHLFKNHYYEEMIFIDNYNTLDSLHDKKNGLMDNVKIMLENTQYYDMFIKIFYENLTLVQYAEKKNISYSTAYLRYLKMIEFIKKRLT